MQVEVRHRQSIPVSVSGLSLTTFVIETNLFACSIKQLVEQGLHTWKLHWRNDPVCFEGSEVAAAIMSSLKPLVQALRRYNDGTMNVPRPIIMTGGTANVQILEDALKETNCFDIVTEPSTGDIVAQGVATYAREVCSFPCDGRIFLYHQPASQ